MPARSIVGRFIFTVTTAATVALTVVAYNHEVRAQDNREIDLIGTPDLIVRQDKLAQQWVVRDENLAASFCSVQEGGVTPGVRRLVRFTVMTPNIGDADVYIGDPAAHVDDGLFEFASCHQHYHFKHYALYELVDPQSGKVWRAAKRGFCMLDTDPNPDWLSSEPPRTWIFRSCGSYTSTGNQGISHGWTDTYRFFLGGQYFVLDGGDGQDPVPPGTYVIRVTVNPPYTAKRNEICRVLDPATGLCHQFEESNYENNVSQVTINIPSHPGRDGVGPMAGTAVATTEQDEHGEDVPKTKK
jgi:Lysyl oxidase